MTKKQYMIPEVAMLPVVGATILCASGDEPSTPEAFTIIGGGDPNDAY